MSQTDMWAIEHSLFEKGITIVCLRQKNYITVDGKI